MKQALRFYLLACAISWIIALPLALPYFGIHLFSASSYHHAFVGLGPMLAALIVKPFSEGKSGWRQLGKSMFRTGNSLLLLVALLGPFVLLLGAATIHYFREGSLPSLSQVGQTVEFPQFSFLAYFLYNLVFFGFGEEVGWKGVMLPAFQRKWSALTASVLFTFFWAFWHLPLFFYRPGYLEMGVAGTAGWFFSLLTGSILLSWLFNSSKGSILVCAVFHATIDMAFVNDFASPEIVGYLGFLITLWGVVTILLFGWRELSRRKRVQAL